LARFLLIHGASHGAWCWREVLPALDALGHEATAIDLPSHGADATPLAQVTMESYVEEICAQLTAPTILVGHSMAGGPITLAAERRPDLIRRLVYLTAYIPRDGLSLADMREISGPQPVSKAVRVHRREACFDYDPAQIREVFYHDCPEGTLDYAARHLCKQPLAPFTTTLTLTGRVETLARSYIVCAEDRALCAAFQREMASALPASDIHELPSSHSPFFADPQRLAQLLHSIAEDT
jgi:pimeloyl-ACP methyl ester carboxylesterase